MNDTAEVPNLEVYGPILGYRLLPDGRAIVILPQLFTVKLTIGRLNASWHDDGW